MKDKTTLDIYEKLKLVWCQSTRIIKTPYLPGQRGLCWLRTRSCDTERIFVNQLFTVTPGPKKHFD